LTTLLAAAEPVGLLFAEQSLWPLSLIYVGSIAVFVWRYVLLEHQKRRDRRKRRPPPNG
jgi:hypothetical protein